VPGWHPASKEKKVAANRVVLVIQAMPVGMWVERKVVEQDCKYSRNRGVVFPFSSRVDEPLESEENSYSSCHDHLFAK
jgi:hypothetical protein